VDREGGGGWLLQRYMLHADFHFSELFRIFVQFQTGIESGRTGGPRPTDQDAIDLNQAFFDINWNLSNGRRLTFWWEGQCSSQILIKPNISK